MNRGDDREDLPDREQDELEWDLPGERQAAARASARVATTGSLDRAAGPATVDLNRQEHLVPTGGGAGGVE